MSIWNVFVWLFIDLIFYVSFKIYMKPIYCSYQFILLFEMEVPLFCTSMPLDAVCAIYIRAKISMLYAVGIYQCLITWPYILFDSVRFSLFINFLCTLCGWFNKKNWNFQNYLEYTSLVLNKQNKSISILVYGYTKNVVVAVLQHDNLNSFR